MYAGDEEIKGIIKNLNFNTYKKSIAIYVSPVFEKVLYLDIAVEEKIIIDESFEIRDLVSCKREIQEYLVPSNKQTGEPNLPGKFSNIKKNCIQL